MRLRLGGSPAPAMSPRALAPRARSRRPVPSRRARPARRGRWPAEQQRARAEERGRSAGRRRGSRRGTSASSQPAAAPQASAAEAAVVAGRASGTPQAVNAGRRAASQRAGEPEREQRRAEREQNVHRVEPASPMSKTRSPAASLGRAVNLNDKRKGTCSRPARRPSRRRYSPRRLGADRAPSRRRLPRPLRALLSAACPEVFRTESGRAPLRRVGNRRDGSRRSRTCSTAGRAGARRLGFGSFGDRWHKDRAGLRGRRPTCSGATSGARRRAPDDVAERAPPARPSKRPCCRTPRPRPAWCPTSRHSRRPRRRRRAVVVDAVSGLGAVPLETDEWGVDVVVSGSQKAS